MATNTTDRPLVWVVLALAAIVVLPAILMGIGMLGMGPMMGGGWGHGMWGGGEWGTGWMLLATGLQVLVLVVLVGAGYLAYRALTTRDDPALEELRTAYARGELDDEEFERRRDRLETDS